MGTGEEIEDYNGATGDIAEGWRMPDLDAHDRSVDDCLRASYFPVFHDLVNKEREVVTKAAGVLEKLGLPKAGEELMRRTFHPAAAYWYALDSIDDDAGMAAKELLCTVRYDESQVLVLVALLQCGMTVMASRVAR